MAKRGKQVLGIIQLLVAVGALPAGYLLFTHPDGQAMNMNVNILAGSPFRDFFIPGLFLFIVNGLFNLAAAVLSFKKYRHSAIIGMLLGITLVLWICVQVYSVGLTHFLQPAYFIIGIGEIVLSIFIYRSDLRSKNN